MNSQESEGVGGGVLMLGRIYNQRAQCFEKLKRCVSKRLCVSSGACGLAAMHFSERRLHNRWTEAVQDYDCAIDAVPAGRGRAALYANRAQVKHLLGAHVHQ